MNQNNRNIISLILAGLIVMINLIELGMFIDHVQNHNIVDSSYDSHYNCKEHPTHIKADNHLDICKGDFFNFMPQISNKQEVFVDDDFVMFRLIEPLFLTVKQYSSSYKHLFTSRPPPSLA